MFMAPEPFPERKNQMSAVQKFYSRNFPGTKENTMSAVQCFYSTPFPGTKISHDCGALVLPPNRFFESKTHDLPRTLRGTKKFHACSAIFFAEPMLEPQYMSISAVQQFYSRTLLGTKKFRWVHCLQNLFLEPKSKQCRKQFSLQVFTFLGQRKADSTANRFDYRSLPQIGPTKSGQCNQQFCCHTFTWAEKMKTVQQTVFCQTFAWPPQMTG